jgi:predicted P-loop ATPase
MAEDEDDPKVIKGKFPRGADSAMGWRDGSAHKGLGILTKLYAYTDKDGNLVARVCRVEWEDEEGNPKKKFPAQSLLEPVSPPWKVDDDKLPWQYVAPPFGVRPLYRLKELLDAPIDVNILLPEGEKDVDTCVGMGFTATTVMGGADFWWGPYVLAFEDRHIIILIDNDIKGRARGEFLRRQLKRVAASVKVVLPAGVGPKGDISDWAKQNDTTRKKVTAMLKANRLPPPKAPEDDEVLKEVNIMTSTLRRNEGWKDLVKNKGVNSKSVLNVANAFNLLEIGVRFDEFNNKLLLSNTGKSTYDAFMVDEAVTWLRKRISLVWETLFSKELVRDEIAERAANAHFNPARDWFESLSLNWNKVPRVDSLLPKYFGAEDTPLNKAYGRKWMMAAVRRACAPRINAPGVKFDYMLVLEGPQGIGKSTALKRLAGESWFTDCLTFDRIKSQKEIIETVGHGKVIIEMSEMANFNKGPNIEIVKSFLSRTHDSARLSYRRDSEDVSRQGVIAGTTNEHHYLMDAENRRFWCVKCGTIDLEAIAQDREQLWAEAAMLAATDESLELPKELWEASNAEAEKRKVEDLQFETWMDELKGFVNRGDPKDPTPLFEPQLNHPGGTGQMVYGVEWTKITKRLGIDSKVSGRSSLGQKLKAVMIALGWNGTDKFTAGKRYFWRVDQDEPQPM